MRRRTPLTMALLGGAALAAGACGDLDNVTTVKDLRVLAVQADPAGFLVPLDAPGAAPAGQLTATVKALVVDPQGQGQELTFSAVGCPDILDTVTGATGRASKLCGAPGPAGSASPLGTSVIVSPASPQPAAPLVDGGLQYEPTMSWGLTPTQVGLFFTLEGDPRVDQAIQYNRDFGVDALVNVDITLGEEKASVIKRLVYWPLLPPELVPANAPPQVANKNPTLASVDFFKRRDDVSGDPVDDWGTGEPTVSLAAGDKVFVQPVPAPDAAEPYLLRVRNTQVQPPITETQVIDKELLDFRFFATAGTFSPAERSSALSPFITSTDGKVHTDSEYQLPKAADIPVDGQTVTVWVVVRDERAGVSWTSRTIHVAP